MSLTPATKCKYCGKEGHTAFKCFSKPRKPIETKTRLKPGKHTKKDRVENKKFRESKLNHQGYLICESCGSWNGSDADHVKGKGANPHLRYDETNKQILCRKCHMSKHG